MKAEQPWLSLYTLVVKLNYPSYSARLIVPLEPGISQLLERKTDISGTADAFQALNITIKFPTYRYYVKVIVSDLGTDSQVY